MLSAADRLRINRLAQGYEPIDSGVAWFKARSDADQLALLRETAMMAEQAGARSEDVEPAAGFGSVDRHYTAAVVLRSGPLRQQVATVLGLPLNERPRSLRMLIGLLSVADARRRATKCQHGCSHWWHRDLSDVNLVRELVAAEEGGLKGRHPDR